MTERKGVVDKIQPGFEPVIRRKVYKEIVQQVITLINEGKLPPGTRLPGERDLAELFGVARPAVREALSALEALGAIEIRQGEGAFVSVAEPSTLKDSLRHAELEASPFEALRARKLLESAVAGEATITATPEDLQALVHAIAEMEAAGGDLDRWMQADRRFHLMLVKCTHNPVLVSFIGSLLRMMTRPVWLTLTTANNRVPGRLVEYLEDHRAILAALQQRNPETARAAIMHHLERVSVHLFGEP